MKKVYYKNIAPTKKLFKFNNATFANILIMKKKYTIKSFMNKPNFTLLNVFKASLLQIFFKIFFYLKLVKLEQNFDK